MRSLVDREVPPQWRGQPCVWVPGPVLAGRTKNYLPIGLKNIAYPARTPTACVGNSRSRDFTSWRKNKIRRDTDFM